MHIVVTDRVEQGTPKGVMKFRPGVKYPVEKKGGDYVVAHEARILRAKQKKDGKTVMKDGVPQYETRVETQTTVSGELFEKLSGFVKVEG